MITVAQIQGRLELDSSGFHRGLDRAEARQQAFLRGSQRLAGSMAAALAAPLSSLRNAAERMAGEVQATVARAATGLRVPPVRITVDDREVDATLRAVRRRLEAAELSARAVLSLDARAVTPQIQEAGRLLARLSEPLLAPVRVDDRRLPADVARARRGLDGLREPVAAAAALDTSGLPAGIARARTLLREVTERVTAPVSLDTDRLLPAIGQAERALERLERPVTARLQVDGRSVERGVREAVGRFAPFERTVQASLTVGDAGLRRGVQEARQRLDTLVATFSATADLNLSPLQRGIARATALVEGFRARAVAFVTLQDAPLVQGLARAAARVRDFRAAAAATLTLDADAFFARVRQASERLQQFPRAVLARVSLDAAGFERTLDRTRERLRRFREVGTAIIGLDSRGLERGLRQASARLRGFGAQLLATVTFDDRALRSGIARVQGWLRRFRGEATARVLFDDSLLRRGMRAVEALMRGFRSQAVARVLLDSGGFQAALRQAAGRLREFPRSVAARLTLDTGGIDGIMNRVRDRLRQFQAGGTATFGIDLQAFERGMQRVAERMRAFRGTLSATVGIDDGAFRQAFERLQAQMRGFRGNLLARVGIDESAFRQGLERLQGRLRAFRGGTVSLGLDLGAFDRGMQQVTTRLRAFRDRRGGESVDVCPELDEECLRRLQARLKTLVGISLKVCPTLDEECVRRLRQHLRAFRGNVSVGAKVDEGGVRRGLAAAAALLARFRGEGRARLSLDDSGFRRGLQGAENALRQSGERMRRQGEGISRQLESVLTGGALAGAGLAITQGISRPIVEAGRSMLDAAMQMDQMEQALTAVMGSADDARKRLAQLQEVAKRPGIGFMEAIQADVQLQASRATPELSERLLKGFSTAVARGGGGAENFSRVMEQISQTLSAGKLQGDELNIINDQAKGARAELEKLFGTSDSKTLQAAGIPIEEILGQWADALAKLPAPANSARNAMDNFADTAFRARARIGKALLPMQSQWLETLAPIVERAVRMFEQLPAPVQRFGAAFIGIAAAIGPAVVVLGGLVALLGAPVVAAVTAATVALAGLGAAFATNFGGIRETAARALGPLGTQVAATFTQIRATIQANSGQIAASANAAWQGILQGARAVLGPVVAFAVQQFSTILEWIRTNLPLMGQTVRTILQTVQEYWQRHGQTILAIVRPIWNIVTTLASTGLNVLLGIIRTVMQVINGDWKGAWGSLKGIVADVWNGVVQVVKSAVSAVWNALKLIVGVIADLGVRFFKAAVGLGKAIWEGLVDGIQTGTRAVGRAAMGLHETLQDKLRAAVGLPAIQRQGQGVGGALAAGLKTGTPAAAAASAKLSADALKPLAGMAAQAGKQGKTTADALARGLNDAAAKAKPPMVKAPEVDRAAEAQARKAEQAAALLRTKALAAAQQTREAYARAVEDATKELLKLRAPDLVTQIKIEFDGRITDAQAAYLANLRREKEAREQSAKAAEDAARATDELRRKTLDMARDLLNSARRLPSGARAQVERFAERLRSAAPAAPRPPVVLPLRAAPVAPVRVQERGPVRVQERLPSRPGLDVLRLQTPRVNIRDLAAPAKAVLQQIDDALRAIGVRQATINSGFQKRAQPSAHSRGAAVDLGGMPNMPQVAAQLRRMGFQAAFERKGQRNPNGSVASGDHIHVNLMTKAQKALAPALTMVAGAWQQVGVAQQAAARVELSPQMAAQEEAIKNLIARIIEVNQETALYGAKSAEARVAIEFLGDEFARLAPEAQNLARTLAAGLEANRLEEMFHNIRQAGTEARIGLLAAAAGTDAERIALNEYKKSLASLPAEMQNRIVSRAAVEQQTKAILTLRDLRLETERMGAVTEAQRAAFDIANRSLSSLSQGVLQHGQAWAQARAEAQTFERVKNGILRGIGGGRVNFGAFASVAGELLSGARQAEQGAERFTGPMARIQALLAGGAQGLRQFQKDAVASLGRLAGLVSPVDAVNAALERFGEAQRSGSESRLREAAEGLRFTLRGVGAGLVEVSPHLRQVTSDVDALLASHDAAAEMVKQFGASLQQQVRDAQMALRSVTAPTEVERFSAGQLQKDFTTLPRQQQQDVRQLMSLGQQKQMAEATRQAALQMEALAGKTAVARFAAQQLGVVFADLDLAAAVQVQPLMEKFQLGAIAEQTRGAQLAFQGVAASTEEARFAATRLQTAWEDLTPAAQAAARALMSLEMNTQIQGSIREANLAIEAMVGQTAEARFTAGELRMNYAQLPPEIQRSVRELMRVREFQATITNLAQGIHGVFSQAFGDLYQRGFRGFFSSVVSGFRQMLQQMASEYLASELTRVVMRGVGGLGQRAMGKGLQQGGTMGGLFSQLLGGVFGGLFGGRREHGGPVETGRDYLVGERGPEMFLPHRSGTVLNAGQVQAILKGAGQSSLPPVNVYVNGVRDSEDVRRAAATVGSSVARELERQRRRNSFE